MAKTIMSVMDDTDSSNAATQFFWKVKYCDCNHERNNGDRGNKCDRREDGVVLDLVQDAAPYRELRRPVTNPAPLGVHLAILEAAFHSPRLQRSGTADIRLTVLDRPHETQAGGS